MIQTLIVDAVVTAAALWLAWSFAPAGVRRRLARMRPGARADAPVSGAAGCGCGSTEPCED